MLGMLQLCHSESELSSLVLHQAAQSSALGDKSFDKFDQANDSKFKAGHHQQKQHSRMPSLHCEKQQQQTRNNASTASRLRQPTTIATIRHTIQQSNQTKMNNGRSKSSGPARASQMTELDHWHKLMDDYERLQFVASSRARNKLIDSSSSSSESSLNSRSSSSQASTTICVTELNKHKGCQESPQRLSSLNGNKYQDLRSSQATNQEATVATVTNQSVRADKQELRADEASLAEVGQCLDELVEAVAISSAQATILDHQGLSSAENNASSYKTFKLHEAILAKTHSSSSSNATTPASEDSSSDETEPGARRWGPIAVESLGALELDSAVVEPSDQSQIMRRARDLARVCRANTSTNVVARLDLKNRSIRCADENHNTCEFIDLDSVTDCLLDDQLVVWLLRSNNQGHAKEEGSTNDEENALDLDDIALALNEPITVKSGRVSSSMSAIVWKCRNSSNDAIRLREAWLEARSVDQEAAELHQIEVKPSEVESNSATAEQMKSSGLFVLQPESSASISKEETFGPTIKSSKSKQAEVAKVANGPVQKRSDRLGQRVVSCIDLTKVDGHESPSPSATSQAIPPPPANSNLANIYRSVASKVIGSGSNRFKNFSLESGRQTLARGAKRLSMALNQLPNSSTAQAHVQSNSQANPAYEPMMVPKVKPRTSVLKRETNGKLKQEADHPHADAASSDQAGLPPRSILKKNHSENSSICDRPKQPIEHSVSKIEPPSPRKSLGADGSGRRQVSSKAHNLQEQLDRMRVGTASSVASRARQRRPALLLAPSVDLSVEHHLEKQPNEPQLERSSRAPNVSTSSPIDGTVRAKVSMSHLRRSASMKVLVVDQKQQASLAEDSRAHSGSSVQVSRKKSEFDPRSLRKLSCSETARALRSCQDEKDEDQEVLSSRPMQSATNDQQEASQEERRLMRERARRRRSMANLAELKSELDEEQAKVNETRILAHPKQHAEVSAPASHNTAGGGGGSGQAMGKGFNLLRQSFKQKNLSSILSFATSRQSLRVKSSPNRVEIFDADHDEDDNPAGVWTNDKPTGHRRQSIADQTEESIGSKLDQQKLEAIKVAEANLLAAKHLKQQAQRLREQQRKSEQQQTSIVDTAAILFYNQQLEKQQQQQQKRQQLIYQAQQQQFAFATGYNQHMFDPMTLYQQQQQQQQLHLAQQFQIQQQQQQRHQQQLAYFSNHSAHFMAAAQHQMATLVQAPVAGVADHLYSVGRMQAIGGPSSVSLIGQQQLHHHNQTALINHQQRAGKHLGQQPQQSAYLAPIDVNNELRPSQHFIPMSVNHHSSFNIVYTAAAAAAAAANQQQQHQHNLQQQQQHQLQNQLNIGQTPAYLAQPQTFVDSSNTMLQLHQPQHFSELASPVESSEMPARLRSKHSSLGASVRKTMRSILGNGKSIAISTSDRQAALAASVQPQQPCKPLKSALKISSTALKEQHQLNSEGSDGDASSSSDSTLNAETTNSKNRKYVNGPKGDRSASVVPSSASVSSSTCSPSSSDSSLASSSGTIQTDKKSATLTKRDVDRLRREFILSNDDSMDKQDHHQTSTTRQQTARRSLAQPPTSSSTTTSIVNPRKNVTFSTKLTSIL